MGRCQGFVSLAFWQACCQRSGSNGLRLSDGRTDAQPTRTNYPKRDAVALRDVFTKSGWHAESSTPATRFQAGTSTDLPLRWSVHLLEELAGASVLRSVENLLW